MPRGRIRQGTHNGLSGVGALLHGQICRARVALRSNTAAGTDDLVADTNQITYATDWHWTVALKQRINSSTNCLQSLWTHSGTLPKSCCLRRKPSPDMFKFPRSCGDVVRQCELVEPRMLPCARPARYTHCSPHPRLVFDTPFICGARDSSPSCRLVLDKHMLCRFLTFMAQVGFPLACDSVRHAAQLRAMQRWGVSRSPASLRRIHGFCPLNREHRPHTCRSRVAPGMLGSPCGSARLHGRLAHTRCRRHTHTGLFAVFRRDLGRMMRDPGAVAETEVGLDVYREVCAAAVVPPTPPGEDANAREDAPFPLLVGMTQKHGMALARAHWELQ